MTFFMSRFNAYPRNISFYVPDPGTQYLLLQAGNKSSAHLPAVHICGLKCD